MLPTIFGHITFSVRIEKGWLKIKFAIRGKRKKDKDRFLDPYFVAGA